MLKLIRVVVLVVFSANIVVWTAGHFSALAETTYWILVRPTTLLGIPAVFWAWRRRDLPLLATTGSAVLLAAGLWTRSVLSEAESLPTEAPTHPVVVVTYNVLFRGGSPGRSLALLEDHPADIYFLQEVTPKWAERLGDALRAACPHHVVNPHRGTHGFAVFSKYPLEMPSYLRNEQGRAVAQCVQLSIHGQHVVACNAHLASPAILIEKPGNLLPRFDKNAAVREQQWQELQRLLKSTYGDPKHVLIIGDLNTLEAEPLYRKITRSFVDVFRRAGSGMGATFPNLVRFPPWPILRLDYVLSSPSLLPMAAEVLPAAGSDHLGVVATIAVPAVAPPERSR